LIGIDTPKISPRDILICFEGSNRKIEK